VTRMRVAVLSATALGAALLVSGCGAGQISQTAEKVPAVPGANSTPAPGANNAIQLRNVLLEYPGADGYRQGANAPLVAHIFNTGERPVTLIEVTTDAASAVTLRGPVTPVSPSVSPGATANPSESASSPSSPSATVSPTESPTASPDETSASPDVTGASPTEAGTSPGGQPVRVTVPVDGYVTLSPSAGATLELEGLTRPIRAGESALITFVFDNGARFTLDVPVGLPLEPEPRASAVVEGGGHE